ncbi:MAG: ATP-dependent DNA helicase UvrD2 [Acidimicrobiales bacterium]
MTAPGPAALGRGVIIEAGAAIPAPWMAAPVLTIDAEVLRSPAQVVERLHRAWVGRHPVVVELAVDPVKFRVPQVIERPVWQLGPESEPWFDRLHFLVWNNNYQSRGDDLIWWWGRKALRLGARPLPAPTASGDGSTIAGDSAVGDVVLADGNPVWIDGGPRGPLELAGLDGAGLIHHETIELGRLTPSPPPVDPAADLAPDQLAAVAHRSGPARVIAPAGSGKTRVLTERLRHLLGDRRWETETVLAVAYNKEAQLELERRTSSFAPRARTLNSLGLWVLSTYHGRQPALMDERDCRRLVDSLLPGRRRPRANTDPIGPYLEALGTVRLGLVDPAVVEAERDDVDGLAEMFDRYRDHLAQRGAVDFDDQVYGAVEALLADGELRRRLQHRCRHLLVDEFQDLTPAHVLLIRLLALPGLDVFGVGDDDQVIYGHVAADPAFLIDYERLFPGAGDHPLTVNYRCPVPVVEAARNLLGYNHRRVAKEITPGPDADPTPGALQVVTHDPDGSAGAVVDVVSRWVGDGIDSTAIAVLARVNSLLLAPHVALAEAGVSLTSVLTPDILERTGLRAALAYLRIATAGDAIAPQDVVEVLRRPTRGLPQWFPDRLARRTRWSTEAIAEIADQVPDKESAKVLRLAGDLASVQRAARQGTTRAVLETVRDGVGLGSAMTLLDSSGNGQGTSHLDDIDALLAVADLHPDPAGFETWLRSVFNRESTPGGVTLSTIHRVKGREWDRVVLSGVVDGVVPHRLAIDREEERRVLHVGITRGRHRVVVLTDRSRPSPFLGELTGTAPHRPAPGTSTRTDRADRTVRDRTDRSRDRSGAGGRARPAATVTEGIVASHGHELKVLGGYAGTVIDADARGIRLRLDNGGTLTVRYGERVEQRGRTAPLAPPAELWGSAAKAEEALRRWRAGRARTDAVPAYVVLSDAHLRGIALARPTDAAALLACDGIGPTKLDRYGDEILAELDGVDAD